MSGGDDDVRGTSRYVDAGALERDSTSSGVCFSASTPSEPVLRRRRVMFSAIHQTSWSWTAAYHYVPVPPSSRTMTQRSQTAASRLQRFPFVASLAVSGCSSRRLGVTVVAVGVQTVRATSAPGGPAHGHGRVSDDVANLCVGQFLIARCAGRTGTPADGPSGPVRH